MLVKIVKNIDQKLLQTFIKKTDTEVFNSWPYASLVNRQLHLLRQLTNPGNNSLFFYTEDQDQIISLIEFTHLEWDSKHFKKKTGRISFFLYDKQKDTSEAIKVLCKRFKDYILLNKYELVTIDINSWDNLIANAVQELGFKYILTWIDGFVASKMVETFPGNDDIIVEPAKESEIPFFMKMASEQYFTGGRFFLDSNFERDNVMKMYSDLIRNSFERGNILLECKLKGNPIGLFICKNIEVYSEFSDLKVFPLRFLIIDSDYRNKGYGEALFIGTLKYLSKKCDIITTGLEVHNLKSLNLHSKLNFKFNYTHNVFHLWNSF